LEKIQERLEGPSAPSTPRSTKMPVDFQGARQRMERYMERGDYDSLQREARQLQQNIDRVKYSSDGLPLEQKLEILSVAPIAEEAIRDVQEGGATGDDSRIKLGFQKFPQRSESSKRSR